MATAESLTNYCKDKLPRFLGVYPADKINNLFTARVRNGEFFIYNSDSSHKDGTHWRLMMRLSDDTLFCFDSFGRKSFSSQIPQRLQSNINLMETTHEQCINETLNLIVVNYNDLEYTNAMQKMNLKDSQEKWFMFFCRHFTEENNLSSVNIVYNRLTYQNDDSSLCGPWILYVLHCLYAKHDTRAWDLITLDMINSILKHYFFDVNENFEIHTTATHLLPFFHFVKQEFWKYADRVAKKLFNQDFKIISNMQKKQSMIMDLYNPIKIKHANVDIYAEEIEKNNAIYDFLRDLDLLRVRCESGVMISDETLNKIPQALMETNMKRKEQEQKTAYFCKKQNEIKNMHLFYNIEVSDRNETREMEKYINNYAL